MGNVIDFKKQKNKKQKIRTEGLREKVEQYMDYFGLDKSKLDEPFVTNFSEKDRGFYEQAVKEYGDPLLRIGESKKPCITGGGLYHDEFGELGPFWDIFKKLKYKTKDIEVGIYATVHTFQEPLYDCEYPRELIQKVISEPNMENIKDLSNAMRKYNSLEKGQHETK